MRIICVLKQHVQENNHETDAEQTANKYMGADKSLARPGRKQANVSLRMA